MEMTLILFDGLLVAGLTAGLSIKRENPSALPLIDGSTQSPTGTSGPVYGNDWSTTGNAWIVVVGSAASIKNAVIVFIGVVANAKRKYAK